jgi:Neuraminidase (sialidase)
LFTRSTDNGATWSTYQNISNLGQDDQSPDVAVAVSGIHVVWNNLASGNWEIMYTGSTDDGVTWSAPLNISNSPTRPEQPAVAASGSNVHVVWDDNNPADTEVLYARSTDGGATWLSPVNISNTPGISESQAIGASGDTVHVVWRDPYPDSANWETLYVRSIDNGVTWSAPMNISNTPENSGSTDIAVAGDNIHAVWGDPTPGNWEILYARSTDGGTTWSAPVNLSNSSATSLLANVAAYGSNVQVTWSDHDTAWDIMVIESTDNGATWSSPTTIASPTSHPGLAAALGRCGGHIVWQQSVSGNSEIHYIGNGMP